MGCSKKPYAAFPIDCPYAPEINSECSIEECAFFEYTCVSLFGKNILVSILMPYYDAFDTVRVAVNSILKQTYPNWELVIVNDSKDDDRDIKNYINSLVRDGYKIRYSTQYNHGQAHARNEAFKLSSGTVIAYIDADDAWTPEHLELGLIEIIKGNSFVYGEFMYRVYSDKDTYSDTVRTHTYTKAEIDNIHSTLKTCNPISLNTVMHTRALFVVAGGFEPGVVCGEDGLLWRRMSETGIDFGFVSKATAYYCRRARVSNKYHQSINLRMPLKGKGKHLIGGDTNGQELDIQKTYLKRVAEFKHYLPGAEKKLKYIDLKEES